MIEVVEIKHIVKTSTGVESDGVAVDENFFDSINIGTDSQVPYYIGRQFERIL